MRDQITASTAALKIALEDAEFRYHSGGTKPLVAGSRASTVEVAIRLGELEDSTTSQVLPSCSKELEAASKKEGVARKINAKKAVELIRSLRIHSGVANGKHLKNCGFVRATGADRVLKASKMNIMLVYRWIKDPDNHGQWIYTRVAMKDYGKTSAKDLEDDWQSYK